MKENERRWLDGLYPDAPDEWDDPYRFFPLVKYTEFKTNGATPQKSPCYF